MPPIPHAKPENVLKRARELIAVEQSSAALTLLHEHVTSKRSRNTPIASLEPVMILFVELCVTLRKGKTAKDGLYQYKNIAQNTSVQTIELVLRKFMELAENKVIDAQERAEEINLAAVEDLEAIETPESILLAAVSGEQSKDRTDRAVVTPWLKFLWETYRTVLDILRNNARLEVMYQSTAAQAFQFCLKYIRKTEFRRLCELLRNHMVNAAKYQTQMHAINLSDPDTLQRHLDTRFQQLAAAVELELWQEAFRSVEDIHTLLTLSKRAPKPLMMANYYEKLTKIFLMSDNHLFHSAAWVRYYNLLRTSAAAVAAGSATKRESPVTTEAEVSRVASFVVLSALSIPVISTGRSKGGFLNQDAQNQKKMQVRLTNLLNLQTIPTRASIFKETLSRGLLKRARPEIRELYNILEVDFHPLSICELVTPILSQIAEDEEMKKYIAPLQQVILTRLFQQLSQVYDTVTLEFVMNLASFPAPFEITPSEIEKFIMNGCKKGDLSIRIDHAEGILTFESDIFAVPKPLHPGSITGSAELETNAVQKLQSTPSEIVRSHIIRLSKCFYTTLNYVDPGFVEEKARAKAEAYTRAEAGAEKEHKEAIARRSIIEKKKEAAETALASKEKEEQRVRALKQQQAMVAETERLAAETKKREADRVAREKEKIRLAEVEKSLQELRLSGQSLGDVDMSELDTNTLRAMKLAQLEKDKNELTNRLKVTGKRLDHLERALRKEEIALLPQDYEAQRARDLMSHTEKIKQIKETHKRKHDDDVALKSRLSRLIPQYESFRDDIHSRRSEEFEKRRKAAENSLKIEMDKRRKEVRAERERVAKEEEEREAREAAEEEAARKEEEERAAKEEAEAEEKEARRLQREADRKERDEAAQKQQQREAEALERAKARKAEQSAPPTRAPTITRPEPAAPLAGFKPTPVPQGGWRERAAVKAAAEAAAAANGGTPAAETPEPAAVTTVATPERVDTPPAPSSTGLAPTSGPGAYRPGAFRRAPLNERTNSGDLPPAAPPRTNTDRAPCEDRPAREERPPRDGEEEGSGLRSTKAGTWGARAPREPAAEGEEASATSNDGKYRPPVGSGPYRARGGGGLGERSGSGRGGSGMGGRSGSGRDTRENEREKPAEPRSDRATGSRWTRGGGGTGGGASAS